MTAEDQHTILRLLAERRDDLAGERTRILNRLHGLLRGLRPATATVACRRELARDLLSDCGASTPGSPTTRPGGYGTIPPGNGH